ncbi:hypothetical protein M6B38_345480 [Iris pallida]|uniref:Uncharacterized protein n=1 Tax=Iris pallida TaxID=29817 RepID=A0AAX6GUU6_IRIPA|nr:hypothetical protein M6B38_345480 [Iris pallida]
MWCTEEGGTADRCTGSDLRPPPRLRRTGSTLAAWRGEAAHVALGERNHGASLRTEMARDAGAELGGGIVEVAVTTCMVWQRERSSVVPTTVGQSQGRSGLGLRAGVVG